MGRSNASAAAQQCMEVKVQFPGSLAAKLYPFQAGFSQRAPSDVMLDVTLVSDFQMLRVPIELATALSTWSLTQRPYKGCKARKI